MSTVRLAKLHATGNDFLVWPISTRSAGAVAPRAPRALCDRHRGIGADGLIVAAARATTAPTAR